MIIKITEKKAKQMATEEINQYTSIPPRERLTQLSSQSQGTARSSERPIRSIYTLGGGNILLLGSV